MDSPLAEPSLPTSFVLPEGYFATLADALMASSIAFEKSDENVPGLTTALPFTVPDGYFGNLAERLTLAVIRPDLGHKSILPYEVPQDYFSNLPDMLLATAKKDALPRRTRLIALRPEWNRFARLAAAAVLVLGLSFGSYRYLHTVNPDKVAVQQLSKVDDEAIGVYVEQHVDDFDAESLEATVTAAHADAAMPTLSTLDATEIQDYLRESNETM